MAKLNIKPESEIQMVTVKNDSTPVEPGPLILSEITIDGKPLSITGIQIFRNNDGTVDIMITGRAA